MSLSWSVRLRFVFRQHGWHAVLGVLLMVVGVALFWMADQQRREADVLQTQLLAQRERVRRAPPVAPVPDANVALADFQRSLPGSDATVEAVALLHSSAARHGVVLASGEYRLVTQATHGLSRYQITFPASGSYPALRAWMSDALNAQPALALDELNLARQSTESPMVEARVRWSLYLASP